MVYTDEELRECLRQLTDTLGETPTRRQCDVAETTPISQTYQDRFGSWNAALQAAGLSINKERPSYTDDELIDALCEFADRLGETPTCTQLNHEPEQPSATVYQDRFGSWNAALQEAGLDENEEPLSDEQLLSCLQELAADLGQTPAETDIDNRTDLPSAKTCGRRFGSWNAALRVAGLTPNQESEQYDGTDEELLDALRELDAEMDTSPTQEDVNFVPDLPSVVVFARRFGGWNAAKQQAGLSTTEQPSQYTNAELIQELRRVAHKLEKSPTTADMNDADAPSPSTYQRRFDSWNAAKEQAGLMDNRETPTQ